MLIRHLSHGEDFRLNRCPGSVDHYKTHDFLLELSRDMSLPERIRRDANYLLRHYPSKEDVFLAGRIEEQSEKWPVGVLGPVFSSSLTFK
ncbi:BPSL0761 family protein [Pseudomonas aeruginosa]|uniref:BPSL0761 family protein n=1 Tax=Pseudomonas aeruginosa TaxID=287 RepID=UPI00295EB08F|nr:BPSL0761 family protein [Pseudomonas aeruginosa]